jgi:hypothetical protein
MLSALTERNRSGDLDWLRIVELAQTHAGAATLAVHPQTRRTVLHVAVSECAPPHYIGLLIARGADARAECCCGLTPLLLAIARGNAGALAPLARGGQVDGGGSAAVGLALCVSGLVGDRRMIRALEAALRAPGRGQGRAGAAAGPRGLAAPGAGTGAGRISDGRTLQLRGLNSE